MHTHAHNTQPRFGRSRWRPKRAQCADALPLSKKQLHGNPSTFLAREQRAPPTTAAFLFCAAFCCVCVVALSPFFWIENVIVCMRACVVYVCRVRVSCTCERHTSTHTRWRVGRDRHITAAAKKKKARSKSGASDAVDQPPSSASSAAFSSPPAARSASLAASKEKPKSAMRCALAASPPPSSGDANASVQSGVDGCGVCGWVCWERGLRCACVVRFFRQAFISFDVVLFCVVLCCVVLCCVVLCCFWGSGAAGALRGVDQSQTPPRDPRDRHRARPPSPSQTNKHKNQTRAQQQQQTALSPPLSLSQSAPPLSLKPSQLESSQRAVFSKVGRSERYCFATTASCGSSGCGLLSKACSESSAVLSVSAGLHWSLRMSRQIAPLALDTFFLLFFVCCFWLLLVEPRRRRSPLLHSLLLKQTEKMSSRWGATRAS